MLDQIWKFATETLLLGQLARSVGWSFAIFAGFTALVLLLELHNGVGAARMKSRAFFNDVAYALFYRGGFYDVLVLAAIANLIEPLDFLQTNLLTDVPLWAAIAIYWVASDLIMYWVHRAQHRFRWLWVFHSVHHAPHAITSLSQSRRHPVDDIVLRYSRVIPIAYVLGLPTITWIPVAVVTQLLQALQHAELDWRLGPLYPVFVSPVFHSIHHSEDARHHNSNYGLMLSFWDYLFGTASDSKSRPERYGIEGYEPSESLVRQFSGPFVELFTGAPGGNPVPPANEDPQAAHVPPLERTTAESFHP